MNKLEKSQPVSSGYSLIGQVQGLWGICIFVMVFCLLARLPFLLAPGLSIDSYTNLDGWPSMERFISQGRFGQYLVLQGLESIGVNPAAFATLLQGVGLAAFAFSAPLFFSAFGRADAQLRKFVIAVPSLLLVLHPFQAEILTFSEASFTALLAVALGIFSVFLAARIPRLWWLACAILIMAISMYQVVLNYVCLMFAFGALVECVNSDGKLRGNVARYRPLMVSFGMIFLALVLYLLINKALIAAFDVPVDGRGQTLPFDQFKTRWIDVYGLSKWLIDNPLFLEVSKFVRLAFWAIVIGGWGVLVLRLLKNWSAATPLALLIIFALPVLGLGVVLVGVSWWPVPRVLGGIVAIFAMGLYWLCASVQARWSKAGVTVLAGTFLLAAVAIGHRIHSDQVQLNTFDGFLAGKIYDELRGVDGFNEQMPVAVVNNRLKWSHPVNLPSTWMDMNISAYSVPAAVRARISLSTGRLLNIRQATESEVGICSKGPIWPENGFVSVQSGGSALVCL